MLTEAGPASASGARGLLGCKGAGRSAQGRLADWAAKRGGEPELCDAGITLWRFGAPAGGLTRFGDGPLRGWLLGDLFAPSPGAPAAQPADVYRRLGHDWIWQQQGQLALVLWDAERRELALYRDGSSARGLYYHRRADGALVFSDCLDLLVHCPLVPRRLSPAGLHEYLRFLDISSPNTIYDAVFSTEPDQLCLHGRHGLHQRERPQVQTQGEADTAGGGLDAAATLLDTRLEAAVRTRIGDRGPIVSFLSGGVDSAYLCALAAAAVGEPGRVHALTVGFAEPGLDESPVARAVAAHLGVSHRVLRFSHGQYRQAFEALAESGAYPFADPAAAPSLLAFREARGLADLALDGTGADTLLGVMPARHQRIAVQYAARLPYRLRRPLGRVLSRLPGLRGYRPLLDFGDAEEMLIRWQGFPRREIERLCGHPVSLAHTRFYRIFARHAPGAHFERYSALLGNLPDDRIHVAAALTGLRVRFPFFDPAVERCVRAMDRPLRYADGEHKRVLRHALARRIPRQIWNGPKHGFDFPFDALLARDDYALVRGHARGENLRRLGCARTADVEAMIGAYLRGERSARFRVWALTVLTAWLEGHDVAA